MSDALIAPTYSEIARLHRHFRLLNGSPEALEYLLATPGPTRAQLQTWLGTPANLTAFQQLISTPSGAAAMCASGTAMAAVAASSTAMAELLNSSVARGAIWASATALAAIQNAPSAVLDALQSHPRVSMMNNTPSNLQSAFISGKSMTLRVRNTGGSDTNYMRTLAGGSGTGDDTFTTSTSWAARVRAYNNLTHYSWSNNYTFQAYVVNMN